MAKVDQTQLNFSPSTQSNTGTAGGSMNYVNLGGLKICWGVTGFVTAPTGSSTNSTITLPSGFFSTIQSVTVSSNGQTNDNRVICNVASSNTTTITINTTTPTATSGVTTNVAFLVIGT